MDSLQLVLAVLAAWFAVSLVVGMTLARSFALTRRWQRRPARPPAIRTPEPSHDIETGEGSSPRVTESALKGQVLTDASGANSRPRRTVKRGVEVVHAR
jgi:hypothetical protein